MTEEETTQRIYRTDVGIVDWDVASNAAQAVVCGDTSPDNFRTLSALFATALARRAPVATENGPYDGVRAAQLLAGLRARLSPEGIDELWCLLFALFNPHDREDRTTVPAAAARHSPKKAR